MAKDTFYFSHDYNSRNDAKIKKMLSKHGLAGYGIFWAIIEDLYNNANALPTDYDSIAFDLRTDAKLIENIVKDFDLFVFDGNFFGSLSIQKRIEERNSKSVKARESAIKRWSKDANALQSHSERKENSCDGNAIKERKVKESKVKESKGKESKESKVKENLGDLVYPFFSSEFMNAWKILVSTKNWKKKENSALQASLKKLSKETEQDAIKMIENCVAGGWMGLVELKPNEKNNGTGKQTYNNAKASRDELGAIANAILNNNNSNYGT